MKEKRYYYEGELYENSTIVLEGEEFHHLTNVMRARQNDKICLFNGDGNFYFSTIESISKKGANIIIKNIIIIAFPPLLFSPI